MKHKYKFRDINYYNQKIYTCIKCGNDKLGNKPKIFIGWCKGYERYWNEIKENK